MKVFNDYEELGKALKQARPQKFGVYKDDKMLGLRYARKNPDKVRVKGLVEAYETQDFDAREIASNLLPSAGQLVYDTGEGLVDIVEQALDTDVSILKSLANLAGGGADVLGRKVGLDLDLGTQEAEDMASLMGSEITQSLTPARINKDPATALANAALAVSAPLRGAALGARGAAGLSKSGALSKTASRLGKAADYADLTDPINLLGKGGSAVGQKVAAPVKEFYRNIGRSDDISPAREYAAATIGFFTAQGGPATEELIKIAQDGRIDEVRKWRNMERGELYDAAFKELKSASVKISEKASQAYTRAMETLSVPMRQAYPEMDQLKGNIIRNLEEEFGSGINISTETVSKKFADTPGVFSLEQLGDAGTSFPRKIKGEKYTVSFNDESGVLPEYRSQISKEIEEALNWGSKSGLDIHDWRRRLDKNISRMPGPTDFRGDTTPSAAAFKARTTLRSTLSDNLKNTYDNIPGAEGIYSRAMSDYERIAKLQRDANNFLGVSGTNFDDVRKETIIAELANTYNPNARQSQRPKLLEELERVSGNKNLRLMTVGGAFNPLVSKGLAQRSEFASGLSTAAKFAAGGFLLQGEPVTAALTYLASVPVSLMYNPRTASELTLYATKKRNPSKYRKSVGKITELYSSLPKEMQDFIKQLPPNTPLQRGLERLANEYDLQLTDVNAEEGTKGQRRLLKTLGSAGTPNPSR